LSFALCVLVIRDFFNIKHLKEIGYAIGISIGYQIIFLYSQ